MSNKVWDRVFKDIVASGTFPTVVNRVLLWSQTPRTGKSTLAISVLGNAQRVCLHKQQPIDDLVGGYCLVDGSTKWQDGPCIKAMREGTPLIIDEIDKDSPECRSFLYAVLDDIKVCGWTLPTGERVVAQPGYCVVATTNTIPTSLAEPIFDRFDLVFHADTLSEDLLDALGPFAEPAKTVAQRNKSGQWVRPATVNLFLAASKLRTRGLDDSAIVEALGLSGQSATDFLTVISNAR